MRVRGRVCDFKGSADCSKYSAFGYFGGTAWNLRLWSPTPFMAPVKIEGFRILDLNKNRLTSLELCVPSFLCGLRADLWPFNEFIETGLECSSEAVTCDQAYFPGKGGKKSPFPSSPNQK